MQVCTLLQTDNHANTSPLSFLQAGCPSCRPTNSVKALKAFDSKMGNNVIVSPKQHLTVQKLVNYARLTASFPGEPG